MKKILLLGFSLLLYSFNYGQTSDGEIVISEEHIQRLADKLYELKIERNKAEKKITKNLDEELEIRYLKSIIKSDTSNKDSLRFLIEKMMISDEFVEGFSSAYYSESEAEMKSTSIQSDDAQQILERLAAIEEQLKKNNLSENETIVVQQAGNTQKEDVYITNVEEKNVPKILAVQKQQNDALAETNSKLDSLLKLVNSPKKDSLKATKTYLAEEDTAQNKQTIESLKTQIYLLHAKLDRVLDDKIEAEAQEKVETASTLSDTIYTEKTKEVDSALEAYQARKEKYGNYFQQIFFANNSTTVENEYQETITNLVETLANEPKIDVSIAGYASKTGDENYNQQISMQRALALKKKLMQEGVSPKRILTDYRGIDYDASNLAEARRLDIEFVVRK